MYKCIHSHLRLSDAFYKTLPKVASTLPANGRLAIGRTLGCSQSLPYLCLSEPQGEPTDLEVLGKLSDFLQIDAFLAADYLLGFYKCDESG